MTKRVFNFAAFHLALAPAIAAIAVSPSSLDYTKGQLQFAGTMFQTALIPQDAGQVEDAFKKKLAEVKKFDSTIMQAPWVETALAAIDVQKKKHVNGSDKTLQPAAGASV